MKMSERDRRDWSLLIFIVPLGILLMLIAGQFAMRVIPRWIVNVTMGSNLKAETAGGQQTFMQPLFNIEILTPFAWQDTYLTPNADSGFVFPPFVVLEPSVTPSKTPIAETPAPTETTLTPTSMPVTPSPTVVVTTPPPTSTGVTSTPSTTCDDPSASNTGDPLPCVYPPTTCTDPAASNTGDPLPCVYPPTTCTDLAANNTGGPLPCIYPITTTPDPVYTQVAPPSGVGVDVPPDGSIGAITDGQYIILGIMVVVGITPDNNYDLVFYESQNGVSIFLDSIIIGISNSADGNNHYYEVFNWGNGTPDQNSNANVNNLPADPNCPSNTECDNREIPVANLYPTPGTGILIDVDSASSNPPPGTYDSVWIISPIGGSSQAAQVDSVQAVEVPIPTPTP